MTPPERERSGAWWVGVGIFASRIAGLVREIVLARFFGTSAVADVWRAALRTPNVIQNLLGEGTLSASFIPVYAEFLEQGREEEAGRFAGAVLGLLSVTAFAAALIGIALAPLLMPLMFPTWEAAKVDLLIGVVRILFVMTAILVVSAWALGVLNSHRRFLVSYAAPVAWNGALIAAMLIFGGVQGWEPERLVFALAWAGVAGGLLQLLVQLPWVVPALRGFRLSLDRRVKGVAEAIRNFGPVVAARGVLNISSLVDIVLAGLLASGAVAVLGYAQTLYLFPISLFGMSVAAAELPEMSRRRGDARDVLAARVRSALDGLAFVLVPTTLAFLVLGDLFVAALFEGGRFTSASTAATYAVLAAYTLGLPASAASRTLSSSFYALRDTRTPATIAVVRVVVSALVGVALMFPLDAFSVGEGDDLLRLGAAGLALGAAVGSWLEYGLLRRRLKGLIGPHGPEWARRVRRWAAAGVGGLAGAGAKWWMGSKVPYRVGFAEAVLPPDSAWLGVVLALGTALVFGVTYLVVAHLLGVGMPLRSILRRGRGAR
ncbi:MAG: murein biosynthesis integral membrane protein MurJ [Gemmatimonadetes bacterium]|nr:murein biosynthesis integral membrane protein MurJ [Gemmatimonadota bacterium]